VVVGWGRYLKNDTIMVASDAAADDELAKTMMEMGAPVDVRVDVVSVAEGSLRILRGDYDNRKAIVLFETPSDVLRMLEAGVNITSLNVGGMHYREGKCQIFEAISVNERDCEALRAIAARGVNVYFQMVPQAKPLPLLDKLPPPPGD